MTAELALLTFVTPCDWDCEENYLDASTIPHNNHNPQSTHLTHLRGTFVRDLGSGILSNSPTNSKQTI